MKVGVVIVTAGSGIRTGEFRGFLEMEHPTMFERIFQNYHRAGIRDIVMVTRYHEKEAEFYLQRYGITFLRAEDEERSSLADCIKAGIEYIGKGCEKIFISSADTQFFVPETIRILLKSQAELAIPVYKGRPGSLACISGSVITDLRNMQESDRKYGTLHECIKRAEGKAAYIEVEDEGILLQSNTVEEYQRLRMSYGIRNIYPVIKVRLVKRRPFFGPGIVTLLNQIDRLGSVREACARTGISYSKGWTLIHTAEEEVGYKLVERMAGGKNGGKAYVTDQGRKLLEVYERYRECVEGAAEELFKEIFSGGANE